MKKSLLLIPLACVLFTVSAQLNNSVFFDAVKVVPEDSGRLALDIRTMGFSKNNEYFATIVDGYTLYGFQFAPTLSYTFAPHWRLDAGVWAQKDFGNPAFTRVAPMFTVKFQKGHLSTLFGNIEGSLHHRLIEPLYDFERVLGPERLENGGQVKIDKPGLFLDAWIDWQVMQYLNDTKQEEMTGGLSINKRIGTSGSWEWSLPFQLVVKHRGGQLDVNPAPLITLINSAAGIQARRTYDGRIKELRFDPYLLFYRDASFTKEQVFRDGSGLYLNVNIRTRKGLEWMVSWWQGHEFQTIQGGKIYPSVSVQDPALVKPRRELVVLRLLYTKKVNDAFSITGRLEPHYDFRFGGFEYAFGIYLNFHDRFHLGTPRRKP